MEFILKADIKFDADNISDACQKVAEHFSSVCEGSDGLEFLGEVHLAPSDTETAVKGSNGSN